MIIEICDVADSSTKIKVGDIITFSDGVYNKSNFFNRVPLSNENVSLLERAFPNRTLQGKCVEATGKMFEYLPNGKRSPVAYSLIFTDQSYDFLESYSQIRRKPRERLVELMDLKILEQNTEVCVSLPKKANYKHVAEPSRTSRHRSDGAIYGDDHYSAEMKTNLSIEMEMDLPYADRSPIEIEDGYDDNY